MNNDSFYKRTAPSGSLPMDGSNPLTQVESISVNDRQNATLNDGASVSSASAHFITKSRDHEASHYEVSSSTPSSRPS
jgi:hypothetical protein